MTIQLKLQGSHITFKQNQVMLGDSRLALIADVPAPVTIQPGHYVAVPTPISFAGDGKTIALLDIHVARLRHSLPESPEAVPGHGSYFLPPIGEEATVVVDVMNDTGATFVIHPGHQIGILTFINLGAEDVEPSSEPMVNASVDIGAIFAPTHINAADVPTYASADDVGVDLKADLDRSVTIEPNSQATIPTGLTVLPPPGYEPQILAPLNAPDTVVVRASRTEGEIAIIVENNGDDTVTIEPADFIGQLIFVPVVRAALIFGRTSSRRTSAARK